MAYTIDTEFTPEFQQRGTVRPGRYSYVAKVYDEPSEFGIEGGHVSKLTLLNRHGECVAHYERGWDVKPEPGSFSAAVVDEIVHFYREHAAELHEVCVAAEREREAAPPQEKSAPEPASRSNNNPMGFFNPWAITTELDVEERIEYGTLHRKSDGGLHQEPEFHYEAQVEDFGQKAAHAIEGGRITDLVVHDLSGMEIARYNGQWVLQPEAGTREASAIARITDYYREYEPTRQQPTTPFFGQDPKTKNEQVDAILLRMGDMHSHYDIEPRDGGFALIRTFEIDDSMLAEYGVPAEQVFGWTQTLDEMQNRIIAEGHFQKPDLSQARLVDPSEFKHAGKAVEHRPAEDSIRSLETTPAEGADRTAYLREKADALIGALLPEVYEDGIREGLTRDEVRQVLQAAMEEIDKMPEHYFSEETQAYDIAGYEATSSGHTHDDDSGRGI